MEQAHTLNLPSRVRSLTLVSLLLITVGAAALDYVTPALELRPLAYLLIIAITAVAGWRWGLVTGIVAAFGFTAIESMAKHEWPSEAFIWNGSIVALSLIVTVALVEAIGRRTIASQKAREDLSLAQMELADVKRLHDVEAALYRSEERFAAVGESLPFGTWELNADGQQLVYMSDSYCKLFGMSAAEIAHGGWRRRVPREDAERFLALWAKREESDIFEGEYRVNAVDGNTYWILSRGVRLKNSRGETTGWAGFSLDITERKRSEQQVRLLSDLGQVLSLSLEPLATCDRAARLLVPTFADCCAVDLIDGEHGMRRVVAIGMTSPENDRPSPTSARVIATQRSQLKRSGQDGGCLIAVPLIARAQTLGAVIVATRDSTREFNEDDLHFAGIVGRRIALALDNALLYERERRVADIFQRGSLPAELPVVPGIHINAHYQPGASEAEIGGDWYDAFQLADGRIGLSIGDVAGKGLHAASIMSTVRLLIRATALEGLAPSAVLSRANNLLFNERPTMVTAVFGVLDPEELTFECAIAGHPLPLVADSDGEITAPEPVAPPLGITADALFPTQALMLPMGSLLVLYTDGLIEGRRDMRNGEPRLRTAIASVAVECEPDAAEAIASRLAEPSPADDVAIMTVRLAAKPLLELDLTLAAQPTSSRIFRQALRRLYLAAGINEETIAMLQVAVGEALTNSIQHAYGVRGGAVRLQGKFESGKLVVDISDTGRWRGPHASGGGYGLHILKSIVQDVAIKVDASGTNVRLTQPIGRPVT